MKKDCSEPKHRKNIQASLWCLGLLYQLILLLKRCSSVPKFCSSAAAPVECSTESHQSSALVGCSMWAAESLFPVQQLLQSCLSSCCYSVLGMYVKPGCACKNFFAFDSSTDDVQLMTALTTAWKNLKISLKCFLLD